MAHGTQQRAVERVQQHIPENIKPTAPLQLRQALDLSPLKAGAVLGAGNLGSRMGIRGAVFMIEA
ncbi:MAG: hypothetical protein C4332_16120 [Meiothermus sp.]